jgi:hypothetical protein
MLKYKRVIANGKKPVACTAMIAVLLIAIISVAITAPILSASGQSAGSGTKHGILAATPIAISGNNIYITWPNNDTGHWNIFFAKSTDEVKTLKTMMISAPNNGNTVNLNTQISASGTNVYVTWWTNKTGTLMPVFRASNDNGDTFAKAITLNSTG